MPSAKKPKDLVVRFTCSLPGSLVEWVAEQAKEDGRSASNWVSLVLKRERARIEREKAEGIKSPA